MRFVSDAFDPSTQKSLFTTEKGDLCIPLLEIWPCLLADLGLLGSLLIVSRNESVALVSTVEKTDLWPIPQSSEIVDLLSDFSVETQGLNSAVAVKEAGTGSLSLHFFDRSGQGVFKVILGGGSDLGWFDRLIQHYAKNHPEEGIFEGPSRAKATDQQTETKFTSNELCHAFHSRFGAPLQAESISSKINLPPRQPRSFAELVRAIQLAHRQALPLRFHLKNCGAWHRIEVVPRQVHQCGTALHISDIKTDAHLFSLPKSEIWSEFHGPQSDAVLTLATSPERPCAIECVGTLSQRKKWNRFLID